MSALGIDFGTRFTRVAVGGPDVLDTPETEIPSWLAVSVECARAGDQAERYLEAHPGSLVSGVKRLLGRAATDDVAQVMAGACGLELAQGADDLVVRTATGGSIGVRDAAGLVLREALVAGTGTAEGHAAVATAPAWFGSRQEIALTEAARAVGIELWRCVDDGAAAALWLRHLDARPRTVAVVNLGAGGVGASVIRIDEASVFVEARIGNRHCGGDDVTCLLAAAACAQLGLEMPRAHNAVRMAIDALLPALARQGCGQSALALDGEPVRLSVDEAALAGALQPLALAIDEVCQAAIEEASLSGGEVETLYVMGSIAAFRPLVDRAIAAFRGVARGADVLGRVSARGAAYQAWLLAEGRSDVVVIDGQSTSSRNPSLA